MWMTSNVVSRERKDAKVYCETSEKLPSARDAPLRTAIKAHLGVEGGDHDGIRDNKGRHLLVDPEYLRESDDVLNSGPRSALLFQL